MHTFGTAFGEDLHSGSHNPGAVDPQSHRVPQSFAFATPGTLFQQILTMVKSPTRAGAGGRNLPTHRRGTRASKRLNGYDGLGSCIPDDPPETDPEEMEETEDDDDGEQYAEEIAEENVEDDDDDDGEDDDVSSESEDDDPDAPVLKLSKKDCRHPDNRAKKSKTHIQISTKKRNKPSKGDKSGSTTKKKAKGKRQDSPVSVLTEATEATTVPEGSSVSDSFRANKEQRRTQSVGSMSKSAQKNVKKLQHQLNDHARKYNEMQKEKEDLEQKVKSLEGEKNDLSASLEDAMASNVKEDILESVVAAIKKGLKKCFRTTKFVNSDRGLFDLTMRVIDVVSMEDLVHKPNETQQQHRKIEQKRMVFFKQYGKIVARELNTHRNYVQVELKKICLKWMVDNKTNKLFTVEDLEFAIKRDFSSIQDDPEKLKYFHDLLDYYVDRMVPAVAGNTNASFGRHTRHFEPLCTAEVPNCVEKNKLKVPPTTEAFILLLVKNCDIKWEAMNDWDVAQKHPGPYPRYMKSKPDKNLRWKTKYTDNASGQSKFGGWSKEGIKEFVRLKDMITEVRKNKELCLAVDTETMQ